ncbi:iron-sulfur cluster biosynthesis family protein [Amylolactobacillus amylophilus]|nr:iron-sulfur cluster biosynthesis family protein [Amylolactobacillus amylophilus]
MYLQLDQKTEDRIVEHFQKGDRLILTFEDGVGPYSQHAMIHMMVQFTVGIISADMPLDLYDKQMDSPLGPIYYKSESEDYLEEKMSLKFKEATSSYVLSSDSGMIDESVNFINFKDKKIAKKKRTFHIPCITVGKSFFMQISLLRG